MKYEFSRAQLQAMIAGEFTYAEAARIYPTLDRVYFCDIKKGRIKGYLKILEREEGEEMARKKCNVNYESIANEIFESMQFRFLPFDNGGIYYVDKDVLEKFGVKIDERWVEFLHRSYFEKIPAQILADELFQLKCEEV